MVKVLVGKREEGKFVGHWAEFAGEKVGSYADVPDVVYTLYKYTDPNYTYDAYRVHFADERDPRNPIYRLLPYNEESRRYEQPYTNAIIAEEYPLFIKHLGGVVLDTLPIDSM